MNDTDLRPVLDENTANDGSEKPGGYVYVRV
jgi:hypothetical protein